MKKYIYNIFIVMIALFLVQSCDDSDSDKLIDFVVDNATRGATLRTMNLISPSFDLLDTSSEFSVLLEERDHEEGTLLAGMQVFLTFRDNFEDDIDNSTPEILFETIDGSQFTDGPNGFPQFTYSAVLSEVLAATGVDFADTNPGDQFQFRLVLDLTDGRSFTNDASGNVTGGSFFSSPFFYAANLACASDIGGTFDYVSTNLQAGFGGPCPTGEVTGTVTWADQGGGNYLSSDLGFGQYESTCWNDTPATSGGAIIIDICNEINPGGIGGLDQYGLTYVYSIKEVDGPVLKLSWANDYADSGDVVLTRQDGKDWPPIFTSN